MFALLFDILSLVIENENRRITIVYAISAVKKLRHTITTQRVAFAMNMGTCLALNDNESGALDNFTLILKYLHSLLFLLKNFCTTNGIEINY